MKNDLSHARRDVAQGIDEQDQGFIPQGFEAKAVQAQASSRRTSTMRYQVIMTVVMAGAGIGFGAAGCGQNKISECNALIEVINKGVAAIEKGQKPDKAAEPSAADLKAMADTM